jgi:hypothetical protein
VARDEVRFWSIVETVAAMAVFWWIAIRYETFLLLTTSLFVAPLLLLRSEESTRLGVKWFEEGMFPTRWPDDPSARAEAEQSWVWPSLWIGAAIGIAIGFGLGYPAAKLDLVGHEGWGAFVGGMGFGLTISWLAAAVVSMVVTAVLGLSFNELLNAAVGVGAAAAAAAAAVAVAIAAAGAGAGAAAGAAAGNSYFLQGLLLSFLQTILFATWMFRFGATARHAREGYRRLPTNVRRLALCMTPLQQPELLPGLRAGHMLRFDIFIFNQLFKYGGSDLINKFKFVANWVFKPPRSSSFIFQLGPTASSSSGLYGSGGSCSSSAARRGSMAASTACAPTPISRPRLGSASRRPCSPSLALVSAGC